MTATSGRLFLIALSIGMVTGCGNCDKPTHSTLAITSPTSGATLKSGDDVDASAPGFQYDVVIAARGLTEGEVVRLYTDAAVVDADPYASTPYEAVLGSGETVTMRVTLREGASSLVACAREACSVRSSTVDVTVDASECPVVTFLSPAAGSGSTLVLGAADDVDGMGCGTTFQTNVKAQVEATPGTTVQLLVNGTAAKSAAVDSTGLVDFGAVTLGNRGTDPNTLVVEVPGAPASCTGSGAFGKPILVDCAGPSCAITAPVATSGYLNASNDTDPVVSGLQVDVQVTADADVAGSPVTIVIDGDNAGARTVDGAASGAIALANFPHVPLAEGAHTVQATCTDSAGNQTASSPATWTVDTVPCSVAFTVPTSNQHVTVADDANAALAGIQLATSGSLTGTDCAEVRVADCGAISGATYGPASGATFAATLTLGSTSAQSLCANVRDAAGNVGNAHVDILVDSSGPQVQILSPTANTKFNVAGTAGGVADLTPATPACDIAVNVECSAIGTDVELLDGTSMTPVATAGCVADSGSVLGGRALFASVALPTSTTSFVLTARQSVSGNVGTSTPVAITGDCQAPSLAITSPACGSTLTTANDVDGTTPGVQADVSVSSPNSPQVAVTLSIANAGGGGVWTATNSAASASGDVQLFTAADFDSNGLKNVSATATDSFGNVGTSAACQVTVVTSLPSVAITVPSNNATINASNVASFNCDGNPSTTDLTVTATTDATNGSAATVQIGNDPVVNTTVSGGQVSVCLPVMQQGVQQIVVTVTDTDASDGAVGVAASAPVTISVLTTAPTALGPFVVTFVDHDAERQGLGTLDFAPVADATGNALASYQVRCALTPINDLAAWNAATVVTNSVTPSLATTQRVPVTYKTGTVHYCLVRGTDSAGNQTPMPVTGTSALFQPPYRIVQIDAGTTTDTQLGYGSPVPVGDVNGDGRVDFLVPGVNLAALYFGTPTPTDLSAPSTVFVPAAPTDRFGSTVAGIGDFNNDGRDDFAIGDYSQGAYQGAVYIFFGRPQPMSGSAWPSTVTLRAVEANTCDADVCVRGATGAFALVGQAIEALGDFDGDGVPDVAISAPGQNRVVVVRGTNTLPTAPNNTWVLGTNDPNGFDVQGTPSVVGGFDFGWGLSGMTDVSKDGREDLAIVRPGIDAAGSVDTSLRSIVYRVDGRAYTAASGLLTISGASLTPILDDASFVGGGCSFFDRGEISFLDFDDDGFVDLACPPSGIADSTGAYVFWGSVSGTYAWASKTQIRATVGAVNDYFGTALAQTYHPVFRLVGDLDRDGIQDLLGGAAQSGTTTLPQVDVVYGRVLATRPTVLDRLADGETAIVAPNPPPYSYPRHPGFVGDVNADGALDFAFGDPFYSDPPSPGRFFLAY